VAIACVSRSSNMVMSMLDLADAISV